jgi:N-acetylmuramoyl-L-alanine amidase
MSLRLAIIGCISFVISASILTVAGSDQDRPLVFLDPGHGGADVGLTLGTTTEKNLTLHLAQQVSKTLQKQGCRVELSRSRDSAQSDLERQTAVRKTQPKAMISLHCSESLAANKTVIFIYVYHPPQATGSENAAYAIEGSDRRVSVWNRSQESWISQSEKLAEKLKQHLNTLNGFGDVEVHMAAIPLTLLSAVPAPAVLIETALAPSMKWDQEKQRAQLAQTLTLGIRAFLTQP